MAARAAAVSPSEPPRKLALCMGLNYVGTDGELSGCINDVTNEVQMLVQHLGFQPANITVLTDDTAVKPTLRNMTAALIKMAELTHELETVEELYIAYSGHGTWQTDDGTDELDRRDECLVPLDYESAGMLSDDVLNNVFALFHPRVRVTVKIDACHSGTMLDLRYRYVSGKKNVTENPKCRVLADITMISGCQDRQTSADAYDVNEAKKYSGAMTSAMLHTIAEHGFVLNYWQLIKGMRKFLSAKNFKQVPQLTCTRPKSRATHFMCASKTAALTGP
jgi:metacaspase-1